MALDLKIKTFLLMSLLLLIPAYSGMVDGLKEGKNHTSYFLPKDADQMVMRKLLVDVLDYDDAGPNPRHNPRRGGGKNP